MASISSERERYAYQHLAPGQIRILRLRPGRDGSALSGDLLIVLINDDYTTYDALSYMWGDPTPADTIYLSDRALPIASNLSTALRHLRYIHKPLTIWIDAICINQNDVYERELQIQLMRQIFSCASMVRIWIDEPGIDETSNAVSALKDFSNASWQEVKELPKDPSFWDPIGPVLTNPYWNRAWIQQEVLNARQISLHCTNIIIPGASLGRFQKACSKWRLSLFSGVSHELTQDWEEHIEPFISCFAPAASDIVEYAYGKRFWPLLELLSVCSDLAMTNTQDRVYALMHLASDYEEDGIKVDYAKDEVAVVIEAAEYHVKRAMNINFLLEAYLSVEECSVHFREYCPRLPSWLPQRWLGCNNVKDPRISGGIQENQNECLPDSIVAVERRLRVRGLRVDAVRRCLTRGLDGLETTIGEFWRSSLGFYLRCFFCFKTEKLADELNSLLVDEVSKHVITFQALVSCLSKFICLAQHPRHAYRKVGWEGRYIRDLLESFDEASRTALHHILDRPFRNHIVMTKTGNLGLIPRCDLVEGTDKVWIALGCSHPIILRPVGNRRYRHVCAARIPKLLELQIIKDLSSDVQLGDKVGEWTVEDIEIE